MAASLAERWLNIQTILHVLLPGYHSTPKVEDFCEAVCIGGQLNLQLNNNQNKICFHLSTLNPKAENQAANRNVVSNITGTIILWMIQIKQNQFLHLSPLEASTIGLDITFWTVVWFHKYELDIRKQTAKQNHKMLMQFPGMHDTQLCRINQTLTSEIYMT